MAHVVVNGVLYVPQGMTSWKCVIDEDGNEDCPDDERQVLVFLNGHVDVTDDEGRRGGGWGIRLGWFDLEKGRWRVQSSYDDHVTHWMDLPDCPVRELNHEQARSQEVEKDV